MANALRYITETYNGVESPGGGDGGHNVKVTLRVDARQELVVAGTPRWWEGVGGMTSF